MPNYHPLFIVGSERSGTTLLRLMLTCHPSISIPPEGDFLSRMRSESPRDPGQHTAFIKAFLDIEKCQEWGLSKANLDEAIQLMQPQTWPELAAVPYWTWLALNYPDASRWGDKNPTHVHRLPILLQMYPHARFIHIVRDGRAVAASWLDAPFGPSDINTAALTWVDAVQKGHEVAQRIPEQMIEIRYEMLVRQPQQVLEEVCEFLREPFAPEMLNYAEENKDRQLVPEHRLKWHANTLRPPDPQRIDRWRDRLTAEQIQAFESVAGDVLDEMGCTGSA